MLFDFNRNMELMNRLETDYLRILCYDLPANFNGIYKTYEYSRICTILQGEKTISVNGIDKTFKYGTNQFLLLPPESNVHMQINQPTKAIVFELNTELIKRVKDQVSNDLSIDYKMTPQKGYYVEQQSAELKSILNKITSEFVGAKNETKFLIDLHAQELVYRLIQDKAINQILQCESNHPAHKAVRYMREHYTQPVSINQLAYDLNMSESNFCQYFKKVMSMTPNEYLLKIKLEEAVKMLEQKSVTETANSLGYENISYFISLFKKEYGLTPKQYQKLKFEKLEIG